MKNGTIVLEPKESLAINSSDVNEQDLPMLIETQIGKLNELQKSVKKAIKAAEMASDSAENARYKSAGFGKKKVAIEELQTAGVDLAKAVQSSAEAQKISFEFQSKLTEISKYLLALGVSNIASNRFVVRELEMRLSGASEEEITELARQELMTVVKQLKEQQDLHRKLENLAKSVKAHENSLRVSDQASEAVRTALDEQTDLNNQQKKQFHELSHTTNLLNDQLQSQKEQIEQHAHQVAKQAKFLQAHSTELTIHAKSLKKLQGNWTAQTDIITEHSETIRLHSNYLKQLNEQLESQLERSESLEIEGKNLLEETKVHTAQIEGLLHSIEQLKEKQFVDRETLEKEIHSLQQELVQWKSIVETKSSNRTTIGAVMLGVIGIILSSIHFFI